MTSQQQGHILSPEEIVNLLTLIQFRILGIFGAKGGIGKSLISLASALMLALQGHIVVLVDLDGNPGLTELYLMMDGDESHREILAESLRSQKSHTTVSRFLLQPELGMVDLLLDIDIMTLINGLPTTVAAAKSYAAEEYNVHWAVNPATIIADTLAFYGSNPDKAKQGKIYLMPNGGSFDDVIAEVAQRKAKHTSYNPLTILLEGFVGTAQEFERRGLAPPTHIIIDTAGELGLIPDIAAFTCHDVILPYKKSAPSVAGVCNTVTNIQSVNRARPNGHRATIHKPIGNFWHGTRGYGNARMADVGLTPSNIRIPEDLATGQVPDEIGMVPFSCQPLSSGLKSIWDYLHTEGIITERM